MKRIIDIFLGILILMILIVPMLAIAIAVRLTSKGSILYWSERVGKNNKLFKMPKFRSMLIDTPIVATHLLNNPDAYFTPIGNFLRRSSLDELPQLISVIKGDMSLVGPRPALYNQEDLITIRTDMGINKLLPGITGWAQINGRDELSIPEKVTLDCEYLKNQSFFFDIKILWMTFLKVVMRDDVQH